MHNGGTEEQKLGVTQEADTVVWMQKALHDLCQPLTALQCRLCLATMVPANGPDAELAELREAVQDSLAECERLMTHVRTMQHSLGERGDSMSALVP